MKKGFWIKMDLETFSEIIVEMENLYCFVKKQYGLIGLCGFDSNFVIQTHCRFRTSEARCLNQNEDSPRVFSDENARKEIQETHLDGDTIEVFVFGVKSIVEQVFNVNYPKDEDLVIFESK